MLTIVGATEVISALHINSIVLMHSTKRRRHCRDRKAAQMFTSQKSAEKGLNKLTGIVAGIFVLCVFLLGFGIIK